MEITAIILLFIFTFLKCIHGKPECTEKDIFRRIKSEDCKALWMCMKAGDDPLLVLECEEGKVVGKNSQCVVTGSDLDTCTYRDRCGMKVNPCRNHGKCVQGNLPNTFDCECKKPFTGKYCQIEPTVREKCSAFGPSARVFDSELCQTYFDCSDIDSETKQPRKKECAYPLLFDAEEETCRHYAEVKCGYRKVIKSKCQYIKYKAMRFTFTPCEMMYPSCEKKADGIQPNTLKKISPWYIVCKDERLVQTGFCPMKNNERQIATKDGCKGIFEVPQKEGGLLPDCSGKSSGFYPLQGGSCRQFFLCGNGNTSIKECPNGLVYDKAARRCELKHLMCKPCGTKIC